LSKHQALTNYLLRTVVKYFCYKEVKRLLDDQLIDSVKEIIEGIPQLKSFATKNVFILFHIELYQR